MESLTGICRFCGMEMNVLAENQETANRMVEEKCTCGGIRIERKKESMAKELDALIGENCAEGFAPVEDAVHSAIEIIGFMMIDKCLQEASFKVDGTVISLKGTAKGIRITRKRTYEQTGEIEE